MITKSLGVAVALSVLAACDRHPESVASPSVEIDMWQTKCLEKLSPELELETSRLSPLLPPTENLDWLITITLKENKGEVDLTPISQPSLRGGGGRYKVDCNSGELTLVEPYR